MRNSEIEMLDKALEIEKILSLDKFEMHHYGDGSYCDFRVVSRVFCLPALCEIAKPLDFVIFPGSEYMTLRLYERYEEVW